MYKLYITNNQFEQKSMNLFLSLCNINLKIGELDFGKRRNKIKKRNYQKLSLANGIVHNTQKGLLIYKIDGIELFKSKKLINISI